MTSLSATRSTKICFRIDNCFENAFFSTLVVFFSCTSWWAKLCSFLKMPCFIHHVKAPCRFPAFIIAIHCQWPIEVLSLSFDLNEEAGKGKLTISGALGLRIISIQWKRQRFALLSRLPMLCCWHTMEKCRITTWTPEGGYKVAQAILHHIVYSDNHYIFFLEFV